MKLLYANADDSADPHLWSGTVWNCRQALSRAGCDVEAFDRIPFECPLYLRLLHQLYKRAGDKVHFLQIEPALLKRAARRIEARFARGDCDAVFSPGTGVPVYAYVSRQVPVFSYLDASKLSWIRTYFGEHSLCQRSRRHVDEVDRVSLSQNRLTFFSSEWAAAEAARDYDLPVSRFAVVPFGANLTDEPTRAEVENWISARSTAECRLLFLGKEWERKGGPEALALIHALNAQGVPATLDIVGCTPPPLTPADLAVVRLHGFIDHSQPDGRQKFKTLLTQTHALIFLSRAEAFGIALCEAAAFGVPAMAARNGGIPTLIQEGRNGWFAPQPFQAEACAQALASAWRNPATYRRYALGARDVFEQRLNWSAAGTALKKYIEQTLANSGNAAAR